jgi:hypothetical protein
MNQSIDRQVGGSGQMNFLIHTTGSPGDYDSWKVPGWDSQTMKNTLDDLTCWTKGNPKPKPFASRPSFLLDDEPEMCSAPVLTGWLRDSIYTNALVLFHSQIY